MPENDEVNDEQRVDAHLEDFDLPSFSEELEIWKSRCHSTYLASEQAQDLRSQCQALNSAWRSMETWARSIAQQQQQQTTAMSEQQKATVIQADADEVVARFDAHMVKRGLTQKCAVCDGVGNVTPAINNLIVALCGHHGPYVREWRRAVGFPEEEIDTNDNNSTSSPN